MCVCVFSIEIQTTPLIVMKFGTIILQSLVMALINTEDTEDKYLVKKKVSSPLRKVVQFCSEIKLTTNWVVGCTSGRPSQVNSTVLIS